MEKKLNNWDFSIIIDPETRCSFPTNSEDGKRILKNYEEILSKEITIVKIKKSLDTDWFADISMLYFLLEKIKTFKTVNNRKKLNVEEGKRLRSMHFGLKKGFDGIYRECVSNERESEIYKLLMDIRLKYFPNFAFNQILINKNQPFKKHKDGNNLKSDTLIFSIGDYKGDLHIEDEEIDTNCRPIIFNGKELEHSVPKISGTRYSILFYMI